MPRTGAADETHDSHVRPRGDSEQRPYHQPGGTGRLQPARRRLPARSRGRTMAGARSAGHGQRDPRQVTQAPAKRSGAFGGSASDNQSHSIASAAASRGDGRSRPERPGGLGVDNQDGQLRSFTPLRMGPGGANSVGNATLVA